MENRYVETTDSLGSKIEVRPLQRAINGHGEQIDKLSELVGLLEHRLDTVRNSSPQKDEGLPGSVLHGSQMLNQVANQTDSITYLQRRVSSLLEELDV